MSDNVKSYSLLVEPRPQIKGASRKLALQGLVPAVVYGHNVAAESVAVNSKELDRVYLRAGANTLVDLRIGEAGEARKVFIHSVQRHAKTHNIRHVDFIVVNLREEITTTIPVVYIGESPLVASGDGLLMTQLDHLQIRALPTDIPPMVEVDISVLDEVGKSLHVSDLKLPDTVHVLSSADEMLASVTHMPTVSETEADEVAAAVEGAEEGAENAAEGDTSDTSES